MNRRAIGNWGEAQVADYLRRRGYKILANSYHCVYGEIDLVARKGKTLCFVEVKLRSNLDFGLPREFVTHAKQQKLRVAAAMYLSASGLDCPVRFDVAEVYTNAGYDKKSMRIEYLEDAF